AVPRPTGASAASAGLLPPKVATPRARTSKMDTPARRTSRAVMESEPPYVDVSPRFVAIKPRIVRVGHTTLGDAPSRPGDRRRRVGSPGSGAPDPGSASDRRETTREDPMATASSTAPDRRPARAPCVPRTAAPVAAGAGWAVRSAPPAPIADPPGRLAVVAGGSVSSTPR